MNITELVGQHLKNYILANQLDPASYAHLQRQIAEDQDLQDRKNMDGHVTSSFALLNPQRTKVLMIHHKAFDTWMFPGGHYEDNVIPRESALRELEEETGYPADQVDHFDEFDYIALDIDTHEIPARPAKDEGDHWHHDFLYLGIAREEIDLVPQVEEVYGARWIELAEAANLPDSRVKRTMAKIIQMVK